MSSERRNTHGANYTDENFTRRLRHFFFNARQVRRVLFFFTFPSRLSPCTPPTALVVFNCPSSSFFFGPADVRFRFSLGSSRSSLVYKRHRYRRTFVRCSIPCPHALAFSFPSRVRQSFPVRPPPPPPPPTPLRTAPSVYYARVWSRDAGRCSRGLKEEKKPFSDPSAEDGGRDVHPVRARREEGFVDCTVYFESV